MSGGLPIREVAEQTGVAAGTIRMWEQRYGFPTPERTAAGYRLYSEEDVETLRRVVELRRTGLSVGAALERARSASTGPAEHPSIFGSVPVSGRARALKKGTLVALSRAIEDQALASAARPIILGAFQRERFYRAVEHRYLRMSNVADIAAVFADFETSSDFEPGSPAEVPIEPHATIGHEWAVVVDAPGFSVLLTAWEPPVQNPPENDMDRIFEAFWTLDPQVVRQASRAGVGIARQSAPAVADELEALLTDRPLGAEGTNESLEALTVRMVGYLEEAG